MMKKIAYLLFCVFIVMPCFNARAYDLTMNTKNLPLGADEKMFVSWGNLKGPLKKMFAKKQDQESFLIALFYVPNVYDEQKNLLNVSAYDLYTSCIISVLNVYNISDDESSERCTTFAIDVVKNVLNAEKNNTKSSQKQNNDDIYNITSSSINYNAATTKFFSSLSNYIVRKYCATQNGTLSCEFSPKLECEKVGDTQFLERDLELLCDRSNWETYQDTKSKSYTVKLKRK